MDANEVCGMHTKPRLELWASQQASLWAQTKASLQKIFLGCQLRARNSAEDLEVMRQSDFLPSRAHILVRKDNRHFKGSDKPSRSPRDTLAGRSYSTHG